MNYYKCAKDLPGHPIGDVLLETNGFYMWEKSPFYTFPKEIVEQFHDFFVQETVEFNEGDDIWYITLNGIIVSDYFERKKHSSLIEFGNIFRSREEASNINTQIKNILSSAATP